MDIHDAIEMRLSGDLEESRAALEELLRQSPGEPLIQYHLATTCVGQGENGTAMEYYQRALEAGLDDPEDGHAVLAYAALLRSQRKYFKAARFLQESLIRRPGDDGIRVFLALTQHKLGMHKEAIQLLVRLILTGSTSPRIQELAPILSFYADDIDFSRLRTF